MDPYLTLYLPPIVSSWDTTDVTSDYTLKMLNLTPIAPCSENASRNRAALNVGQSTLLSLSSTFAVLEPQKPASILYPEIQKMLGAQALRTKQKAEQKEKEKRHKERQRNLELQRERIQKVAQEDAAQALLEAAAHNPAIVTALPPQAPRNIQQRHSVYVTGLNGHLIPATRRDEKIVTITQRSPSSDYGRVSSKERRQSGNGGNRLLKWLGLSNGVDHHHHKDKEKRRMSTF
uniref:SKIP_SNW domain-containing protein n=1 Tax=Steinernema glaseri TaxID=37863 RepID=A0A1I7Z6T6_9BILA